MLNIYLLLVQVAALRTAHGPADFAVSNEWPLAPTDPFEGLPDPLRGRPSSCQQYPAMVVKNCATSIGARLKQVYDSTLVRTPQTLDTVFPYFTVGFLKRLQFLRARFEAMHALMIGEPAQAQVMFQKLFGDNAPLSLIAQADEFDKHNADLRTEGAGMVNNANLDRDNVNHVYDVKNGESKAYVSQFEQQLRPLVESTVEQALTSIRTGADNLRTSFNSAKDGRIRGILDQAVTNAGANAGEFAGIVDYHRDDSTRIHGEKDRAIRDMGRLIDAAVVALAGNIEVKYNAHKDQATEKVLKELIYDPSEQGHNGAHADAINAFEDDRDNAKNSADQIRAQHVQKLGDEAAALHETSRYAERVVNDFAKVISKKAGTLSSEFSANVTVLASSQKAHFVTVEATVVDIASALDALESALSASLTTNQATAKDVIMKFDGMMDTVLKELAAMISSSSSALFSSLGVQQGAMQSSVEGLGYTVSSGGELARSASATAMVAATEATKAKFAQLGELLTLLVEAKAYMDQMVQSSSGKVGEDVNRLNAVLEAGASDLSGTLTEVIRKQRLQSLQTKTSSLDAAADSLSTVGSQVGGVSEKIDELNTANQVTFQSTSSAMNAGVAGAASTLGSGSAALSEVGQATQSASIVTQMFGDKATLSTAELRRLFVDVVSAVNATMHVAGPEALAAAKAWESAGLASVNTTQRSTRSTLSSAVAGFQSRLANSTTATGNLNSMATSLISKGREGISRADADIESVVSGLESQIPNMLNDMNFNKTNAAAAFKATVDARIADRTTVLADWKNAQKDYQSSKIDAFGQAEAAHIESTGEVTHRVLQEAFNETSSIDRLTAIIAAFSDGEGGFESDANRVFSQESDRIHGAMNSSSDLSERSSALLASSVQEGRSKYAAILSILPNLKASFTNVTNGFIAAGDKLGSDLQEMGAKATEFGSKISLLSETGRKTDSQSSEARQATVAGLLSDTRLAKDKALVDLISIGRMDAVQLHDLLMVLDLIRSAQVDSLGSQDANSLLLATRLRQAYSAISDISGSIGAYLDRTDGNLAADAQLEEQQIKQDASGLIANQISNSDAAGAQVLALLSSLENASTDVSEFDAKHQADILNLKREIQALGTEQAAALRLLLDRVISGETSMSDAVKSLTAVDLNSIVSLADAANTLVTLVGGIRSSIELAVSQATTPLDNFSKSFPPTAANLTTASIDAAKELDLVAGTLATTSFAYEALVDKVIRESSDSLATISNTTEVKWSNDTIATVSKIGGAFERASNEVQKLREQEAKDIGAEIQSTLESIHSLFPAGSLAIDNVVWTV